ncbi:MAG TPA: hypothetical protein VMT87_02990 [Vicinamibacteria bacterium]|nr:hypothetical protein [Vicinamibacteria bacterium]
MGETGQRRRLFQAVCVLCGALALVPVWVPRYPPMTDLPQHAAQVALYVDHVEGGQGPFSDRFRTNYFTPVIGGYAVAFAAARLVPARTALKVILSAALIGLVLVTLAHVRRTGGDDWWLVPVFATLASFPFHWGFYNFLVAMPLALALLLLARRFIAAPTLPLAAALAAGAVVMFFFHALAFAFATGAAGLAVVLARLDIRWKGAGLAALASPLPLVVLWLLAVRTGVADSTTPNVWDAGLHRLLLMVTLPFGYFSSLLTLAGGTFLLAYPFLDGARPSGRISDWAPAIACAGVLLAAPLSFMGTGLVYPRFAALLLPCVLIALARPGGGRREGAAERPRQGAARERREGSAQAASAPARVRPWRLAALAVTLVMLGESAWAAVAHAREDTLASVLEGAPPDRRMLYVPLEPGSSHYDYDIHLHSGAWYASEVGGITDFSFAEYFPAPFPYAPGHAPGLYDLPNDPDGFSWQDFRGERYDLFLVRSEEDPTERVFSGAPETPSLRVASPPWWLYER